MKLYFNMQITFGKIYIRDVINCFVKKRTFILIIGTETSKYYKKQINQDFVSSGERMQNRLKILSVFKNNIEKCLA